MLFASPVLRALSAIMVSSVFTNSSTVNAAGNFAMSIPRGFEDMAAERETVLDVYFGGAKLGEARAAIKPGFVHFDDAQAVAQLIPEVTDRAALAAALSGSLPSNAGRACSSAGRNDCGQLLPATVGVILDEERFRVDVFLNPSLLQAPELGRPRGARPWARWAVPRELAPLLLAERRLRQRAPGKWGASMRPQATGMPPHRRRENSRRRCST